MQVNYLENFIQSIFLSHEESEYLNKTLIVGGDGRYYNDIACQIIIKIASANGINKIIVAENGHMSTPAVSLEIRSTENCFGAIILSASHNPGGENEDFGIKFNNASGAPAPENITSKMFKNSKELNSYKSLNISELISLKLNENTLLEFLDENNNSRSCEVLITSTTDKYIKKMKELFDFEKLRRLFNRKDFKFCFDGMHGASGPYAYELFSKEFNVSQDNLFNCNILPDFGGHHPDPNLVHAKKLVDLLDIKLQKIGKELENVYDFGAACDGDADRNMILGKQFFISPSDSIAIIAANMHLIPSLLVNKEKGVARSMPTSGALDRVAEKMGIKVNMKYE
jgi:phosphoglucomutase